MRVIAPSPTRLDPSTRPPFTLAARNRSPWLFSRNTDLSVFLGSALASLALLWLGYRLGVLHDSTPDWAWIPMILLIDVAHVYSTAFRTYFDPQELRRRPFLYALVPVIGLAIGVALYSEGELIFWRALAYAAVFHFVRQQYGWVALYRSKAGETGQLDKWIDTATIYLATVYPLLHWHASLPREFWWFLPGDFFSLPAWMASTARPLFWLSLVVYAARSVYRRLALRRVNPGKDIVVATTAFCWYSGLVWFNSDYAFTVTNVIIHGVPYMALIYWYARSRMSQPGRARSYRLFKTGPWVFIAILWALAFVEEMFWDRGVWHDRSWLFGTYWDLGMLKVFIVPLLALPQLTHYVLDGFIWRRKSNPEFDLVTQQS